MRSGLLLLFAGFRIRRRSECDVDLCQRVGEFGLRLAVQFHLRVCGDELLVATPQLPHSPLLLLRFQVARLQNQYLCALDEAGQFAQQAIAELGRVDPEQEARGLPQRVDSLGRQGRERGRRGRGRLPLHQRGRGRFPGRSGLCFGKIFEGRKEGLDMTRFDLGQAGYGEQSLQGSGAQCGQIVQARLVERAQTDRSQAGNISQTTGRGEV
jgi:hypothetical protein